MKILFDSLGRKKVMTLKLCKNHLIEISQKILILAKWAILAQLCSKIMQAYTSEFALRIFFKLCDKVLNR